METIDVYPPHGEYIKQESSRGGKLVPAVWNIVRSMNLGDVGIVEDIAEPSVKI